LLKLSSALDYSQYCGYTTPKLSMTPWVGNLPCNFVARQSTAFTTNTSMQIKLPTSKFQIDKVGWITNLASQVLIMEIVQNLFIHNSYVSHIDIVHWKHIWHTDLSKNVKFVWHLFIHRFVLHLLTHLSMCQMCLQYMIFVCKMYEPMNEQTLHNFHY
jgi:hypothetical protein